MPLTEAQLIRIEGIKSTGRLLSPQGPAAAVIQLTRRNDVSHPQLIRAIQADPALVARLLKLANSCRATGERPILALQDAVCLLGLTAVRGLALAHALLESHRCGDCAGFDYPAFWAKNLARAVAMQFLADIARFMPRDDAFTLGLLAHVGELALATALPDEYVRVLRATRECRKPQLVLEAEMLGIDHDSLTAALLNEWGFPVALTEPVRCHELPAEAAFSTSSRTERVHLALMLAERIAVICMAPEAERRGLMAEFFLLGSKLAITPGTLIDLADRSVREWSAWCRILTVPDHPLPSFADLTQISCAASPAADFNGAAATGGQGLRVLVVDDDRSMRSLLKALMSHIGHECSEAENGRAALELAARQPPDLMIVDWMMPEMDGIALIRTLRETRIGRGIYILILTSLDQEEKVLEAFAAGADDFLAKPLKPKVLAARLRAGQRVISLQREIAGDQESIKRFAEEFARLNQSLLDASHRSRAPATGTES